MMMKDTIVLYPAMGRGHILSMVELGKLILTQNPSLSITILIHTPPNNTNQHVTAQYTAAVTAAVPSITFHRLPSIPLPSTLPPQAISLELCRQSNQNVHNTLHSISKTSNLKAIIIDFMNYPSTKITTTLEIPTFFYYTSGASSLAVMHHIPTIHENTTKSIKDLHMHLRFPGLPRIYTSDLPEPVQDRESHIHKVFLDIAKSMKESDGVIINTFDAIEGRVIKALSDGSLGSMPPVFCVGPVISETCVKGEDRNGCLSWLDSQPSQSVVLLSFGSLGRFSKTQLKEIAIGLERSKQRFLWVVRSEESDEGTCLEDLLPKGFLERTKEKGIVVRNWAPQAAILSHDSVGGFVTHCGWNSVLEAVCEGVPMVAWPLYAEQKLNRVVLVQEMKVGLELKESKDGFVSGTELGERVKELMDSEKGKEMRQRIFKMKISFMEAKAEGGSSHVALSKLVKLWKE